MTTDNIRLYQGLTYDTHKGALALAQAEYFKALADNDADGVQRWGAEEARLSEILDNWNLWSTPEL